MLTKSHYAAQHFVRCQDRQTYRLHMCGLCHALGDGYGLLSRLLTNHDMILLNLLTGAQRQDAPEVVTRRCPMNPLRQVATNQDSASQFAAAAAVELAAVSVEDDVLDSGGRDLRARAVSLLMRPAQKTALRVLDSLGFEADLLAQLGARQSEAERDQSQDPAKPSAAASAALFAMSARLADAPYNEAALAEIGAHYGAYLYLTDAYRDYAADMARGDFNPLRSYCRYEGETVVLSQEGLRWLVERFRAIQSAIQSALKRVQLNRYADTVYHLLCDPAAEQIRELEAQLQRETRFRQWRLVDALKAGLFVMPVAVAGLGLAGVFNAESEPEGDETSEEQPVEGKRKRKRKRQSQSDENGCGWEDCLYCWSSPSTYTRAEDSCLGGCISGGCNNMDCSNLNCEHLNCGDNCGDSCGNACDGDCNCSN